MENSLIGTVWRHRTAEENPTPESIQEDVCGFQNLEIRWIAAITTADRFHGNDDLARRCGRRTTPFLLPVANVLELGIILCSPSP